MYPAGVRLSITGGESVERRTAAGRRSRSDIWRNDRRRARRDAASVPRSSQQAVARRRSRRCRVTDVRYDVTSPASACSSALAACSCWKSLGSGTLNATAKTMAPASVIASGTVQIFDHWNLPPTEFFSITKPASCVPRNSPMPLVAMKISDWAEAPISFGAIVADEHLPADHEEHVGQAVERLDEHDPQGSLAHDIGRRRAPSSTGRR